MRRNVGQEFANQGFGAGAFWENLAKSRLLAKKDLADAQGRDDGEDPRVVLDQANRLADHGLLTHWQALQLLCGRTKFFLGPYKLLACVGVGGVATIYKAQHVDMGHVVALKVFAPTLVRTRAAAARLAREIKAAVAVNHPNVVTAYGALRAEGQSSLIMEYVNGEDLNGWLRRCQPLPIDWCCEAARQAALGLAHIHQRRLVHRDVKPSNVLAVGGSTRDAPLVKVADLGAANIKFSEGAEDGQPLTALNHFLGTPNYVAPEQVVNGHEADHRADIFSLGCTLFKLLTRELPWTGASLMERLAARAKQDARPASYFRKDLPEGLQQIIAKSLARDPAGRYASADAFARALTPFAMTACGTRSERISGGDALPLPPAAAQHAAATQPTAAEQPPAAAQASQSGQPAAPRVDEEPCGATRWHLLLEAPDKSGEPHALDGKTSVVLGRDRESDIQVRDMKVSRRHCRLSLRGGVWRLEDLGSNNGTLVNERRVSEVELNHGDRIQLGATVWRMIATPAPVATAADEVGAISAGQSPAATVERQSAVRELLPRVVSLEPADDVAPTMQG